jgi:hypothetical protein
MTDGVKMSDMRLDPPRNAFLARRFLSLFQTGHIRGNL